MNDQCEYGDGSPAALVTEDQAVAQETSAAETRIANDQAAANTPRDYEAGKNDEAYSEIMIQIMRLFAWLVGVAMLTLNYAVFFTVITMGEYVKNLSAVGLTWSILRDIGNIMLIFGFLMAGIMTILNVDWYGFGKKMLPMLLVAAVFLNFSLFISEAIVDTGNLFATQFYTQINGGTLPTAATVGNEGISDRIMSQIGLQTIYGKARQNAQAKEIFEAGNPWIIGFMAVLLFIILAFVLFTLAFVLIARFVILLFLIIVSPVGFAGLAIPKLSGLANKWWGTLAEQTLTAPVLMLLLYVALNVILDERFLTGFTSGAANPDWLGFINVGNLTGFASMMLSFLVAMGLLLAVVIFAKSMSAFGAGWATKMGGRLSFGAVSLAGRGTLGMAGNFLAQKRFQSWVNKADKAGQGVGGLKGVLLKGVGKGAAFAGKGVVLSGKGLRSSAYDMRNVPGMTTGLGALGIDAGKGATFTAKQAHEAQYGWKPTTKWFQHSAEERTQAEREMDFKDAQSAIEAEKAALAAGTITQSQYDTNVEPHEQIITRELSKMSTKQLEELGGIKKGIEVLVRNLSPEQFESLMKSDKFSDAEKENMRANRYRSLNGAITAGDREAVRQWSAKDLATAAPDILNNPVQAASLVNLMSEGQFDAVVKNDKLTKGQQQQIRNLSSQGKVDNFLDIAHGRAPRTPALVTAGIIPAGMTPVAATAEALRLMSTMSPKKLAKLPGRILTDPIAMALLTPKHLAAFMTDGDLDPPQISTIATAVRNPAHPNHAAIMSYLDPATNPIAASYWA
ncbi:hypothetical protein A3J11_00540 [Candidatus Kaiserbacteria bacterium RIFCSPLOWO2_02_FULL_55_12]|uniref:Uncharacterized protein n=1 Tax=Candidatus Kaiserbacteria bacterium RIFCSPLOWO2_02_FULL_55_12 TaxID=1798522 RepID=A0A1F6EZ93_9BACT|nr:MAG: hypothetical protein A3J11_00540 [Candidatus Kaiserbacteria bacterium RIFCSPLOWO2_02_FULL_55_12]